MRYRTLFYHAKFGDKKWIDNAIALVTQAWHLFRRLWKHELTWKEFWRIFKMGLSHEEIWVPDWDGYRYIFKLIDARQDGKGNTTWFPPTCHGTCYTSTMGQIGGKNREGKGTVKRPASKVLKHPARWSYTEHEVSDDRFTLMVHWMNIEVFTNKGYGVREGQNVCSEFSHNANVVSGELDGKHRFVDPLGDALLMVKAGKTLTAL